MLIHKVSSYPKLSPRKMQKHTEQELRIVILKMLL